MRFGAHMSTSGGVWNALVRGKSIGCDAVQIFVKNNMQWLGKPHPDPDVNRFAEEWNPGLHVFGHTGYLINLAAPPGPNLDKSIQSLIQEVEFASRLKLPFLVLHPGAHLGAGEPLGIKRVVQSLDQVFQATKGSPVRIALENTAGQGSCLGQRLEHLASIIEGVKSESRLAVCIDTAHLFAAGYDIRTPAGWDKTIASAISLIGLKRIVAFHLNDSKTDLGSRVDRHAHIGQGKIGTKGFRHLVNDLRFRTHPACLETPKEDDLKEDVVNLTRLRKLVRKRKAELLG